MRKLAFGKKPRSLASANLIAQLKLEGVEYRTIIDGGANVGQFARAAVAGFPSAVVHSFEPTPVVAQQLRENMSGESQHRLHQVALGETCGSVEFQCNSDSQTSSVLGLKPGKSVHEDIATNSVIDVPMTTLDRFADEEQPEGPLLLKLDLQGLELAALKGGSQQLVPMCHHVVVETVFEELYDGEPLFHDIVSFMNEAGFSFVRPLAFLKDASGKIVQTDALFRNQQTR
ncbi:MAG: FkbM family methyltransferase [Planctomycetota bacterium]